MTNRHAVHHDTPFFRSLHIQFRVVGALLMREIITRYGRHNVGFLWIMCEPMMFTLGVTALWTVTKATHGSTLPITAFAVTGYSTVLLWRNCAGRCSLAIQPNQSLLYHRNVRVIRSTDGPAWCSRYPARRCRFRTERALHRDRHDGAAAQHRPDPRRMDSYCDARLRPRVHAWRTERAQRNRRAGLAHDRLPVVSVVGRCIHGGLDASVCAEIRFASANGAWGRNDPVWLFRPSRQGTLRHRLYGDLRMVLLLIGLCLVREASKHVEPE